MKGILECCVDSVESALAAKKGGADRLELCQGLVIGGVTPSTALFREIKNQMDIRIHALMRPRFGDFCYSRYEVDVLCGDIRTFRELGADAAVIGALNPDGTLDREAMKRMIDAAGDMSITLHRAFDVCRDPFEALETAKELGVNTILTSGQKKSAVEGMEILKQLREQAEGRIDIMAGAGIDAEAIRSLAPCTGITTFHMSGKKSLDSGMKYRKEGINMGLPSMSEFEIWRSDEEKIKEAREVLDSFLK
ncbi:MAG: copper homeostasis protein CutC [Lachnospiraceae bacterium]